MVQMKEDCHSELSWEREAGMRVQQAGLFLLRESEPEFMAVAAAAAAAPSEEPPGSQGFLDKR